MSDIFTLALCFVRLAFFREFFRGGGGGGGRQNLSLCKFILLTFMLIFLLFPDQVFGEEKTASGGGRPSALPCGGKPVRDYKYRSKNRKDKYKELFFQAWWFNKYIDKRTIVVHKYIDKRTVMVHKYIDKRTIVVHKYIFTKEQ